MTTDSQPRKQDAQQIAREADDKIRRAIQQHWGSEVTIDLILSAIERATAGNERNETQDQQRIETTPESFLESLQPRKASPSGQQQEWRIERGGQMVSVFHGIRRVFSIYEPDEATDRELVGFVQDINAALAADRQLVEWCSVHAPTKDEPIKCCPCCESVNERQCRKELEKSMARRIATVAIERDTLKPQLLSALAAIEDTANDCEEVSRDESIGTGEKRAWLSVARKLRHTNLSALHEHDAEVREPLVKALTDCATMLASIHIGEHLGDCAGEQCPTLVMARKGFDALAKAKEQ